LDYGGHQAAQRDGAEPPLTKYWHVNLTITKNLTKLQIKAQSA